MRKVVSIYALVAGILFCGLSLQAQTPGYLGKKLSLGYRLYAGLGLGQNANYRLQNPERIYIRSRHHVELDYVTSRRTSLGIDAGMYRNGMEITDPFTGNDQRHVQLKGLAGGLHFRFYPFLRKGNIAPLGPYTEIRASYLRYNLIDPDSVIFSTGNPDLGTVSNLALSFTWGRNYLVKGSLMLSYGLQTGLLFPIPSDIPISDDAYIRMWSSWGINFHFGVGGLLF